MTVAYTDKSFLLLLLKWKGSVWKYVLPSYMVFLAAFYTLNMSYRYAMSPSQQQYFEKVVIFFKTGHGFIPIQFLLGFYVSSVVARWWDQVNCIAWPDKLLVFITANIQDRHVVDAGLMTEEEYSRYQETTNSHGRWFLPVSWMMSLLQRCKEEGRVSDHGFQEILKELWNFRGLSATLTLYDWISIPLAYNQVVTVATYGYFLLSLIGRQCLRRSESSNYPEAEIEWWFPFFTTLEFIFYVGWLKVGEELRVPFGEDDEDINMTYVLDRNLHVSFMLVDEISNHSFKLEKDAFWNQSHPSLPHTKASIKRVPPAPNWRLSKVKITEKDMERPNSASERPKSLRFSTKVSDMSTFSVRGTSTPTPMQQVETLSQDAEQKSLVSY